MYFMEIIKVKNYDELSQKAAEVILKLVQGKPDCVLGLATGSTPIGTYQCIRKAYDAGKVDFSTVKSVNLDEYVGLPAKLQLFYERQFVQSCEHL